MQDAMIVTPEAAAAFAGALVAAAVGAWQGWRAQRAASAARDAATVAAQQAGTAARQAGTAAGAARQTSQMVAPVSNGFAAEVLDGQARLERHLERVEAKVDRHIEAHATANVVRPDEHRPGTGTAQP